MSDQLIEAAARLERALARLEDRASGLKARDTEADAPSDEDLFAGVTVAHDTELRAAAQAASEALGRAAEALSAAIGEEA